MKIKVDMATGDDTHKEIKIAPLKLKILKEDYNKETHKTVKETLDIEKEATLEDRAVTDLTNDMSDELGVKIRTEPSTGSDQLENKSTRMICKSVAKENESLSVEIGKEKLRGDQNFSCKPIPFASRVVSSIQLGIERAVASPASKSERDLLMQDFMTFESTSFESITDISETSAYGRGRSQRFVFKTYAPVAFRYFRELFEIKPTDFLESIDKSCPLKELSNSGNSGSVFYVTEDDRFIVKTMKSKECSFLQKLLPGYYMNLHQNPDTLLPKYFGLYCYRCQVKKIKLVVMNNILPSSVKIDQRYDLKGATYKCRVTKSTNENISPPTFKDLDFMLHHPAGLFLENETYNILMKTIKRDCTVLESFKIMDYSLLMGISKFNHCSMPKIQKKRFLFKSMTEGVDSEQGSLSMPEDADNRYHIANEKWSLSPSETVTNSTFVKASDKQSCGMWKTNSFLQGGFPAIDGQGEPVLVFIGIIDILQSYKVKKKLEHAWKSMIHNGDTVSVHNPSFYSFRFQKFMSERVFQKLPVKRKSSKQVATNVQPPSFMKPLDQTICSDTMAPETNCFCFDQPMTTSG